ncbi:flagellar hook-length control protein FliK [Ureibacillus xyleni]|uniref:Flagellar hook-length control protein FliK n=1 Tax=Ureibacillus xyleni TaxID=614648 RepID=A0A285RG31_9BACL|nr:flagellar hook-length control protein FliK [Ureibacillus xyleni]SOB93031.1 flagellar hook-length control protein FliK [Ureibacillus xyleni]
MNIGIMQLANVNTSTKSSALTTQTSKNSNFGEIFSQIANKEELIQNNPDNGELVNFETLEDLLNSSTIEEVLSLLGVSQNDPLTINELDSSSLENLLSGIDIQIESDEIVNFNNPEQILDTSKDVESIETNELLILDNLLNVLKINEDDFNNIVKELLGEGQLIVNDVWGLINILNNQSQELMSTSLIKGLSGEQNLPPQTVQQFLQALKIIEVVGSNSNLVVEQQNQLVKLKELLQVVSRELEVKNSQTTTRVESNLLFTNVVNFKLQNEQSNVSTTSYVKHTEQVVNTSKNQITTNSESVVTSIKQMVASKEQNESNPSNGIAPSITTTKTVTINLPVEKPAQAEAFVKEFQSLLNRTQINNSPGTMKLLVKLYPENLGSIRIEILQKDGVLSARLLASTPQAKELLDSQIQQLKSTFAQQNIQMDRIDIAQSLQETDRNTRDQSLFGNLFKQQQADQDDEEQEESKQEDTMSFDEYLLNEEV